MRFGSGSDQVRFFRTGGKFEHTIPNIEDPDEIAHLEPSLFNTFLYFKFDIIRRQLQLFESPNLPAVKNCPS